MTVPSTTRRAGPFTGTGALVAYPFTFKVFAKQDLAVTIADSNGLETDLVLDSSFTATLNVDQEATPGGTVNYAVGGVATALPSGYDLVVTGDGLEFEQTADLPQGGNFSPVVIENALDRIVMLLQRLWDGVRRSMRLPDTASDSVSTVLPAPTANNFIGWDSNATALRNVDPNTLATVVAFAAWQSQAFSGDGVTTQFTLSSDPGNVNNLDVVVGAVPQRNNVDFTLSGTTLTFDVAPAVGLSVFCRWGQALPEGTSTLQARLASLVVGEGVNLVWYPKIAYEVTAGVTIVNPWYEWGNLLRYGADRTGATSSQTAGDAAKAVCKAGLGYIIADWGDYKLNWLFTSDEADYCWIKTAGYRTRFIPVSSASPVIDVYAPAGGSGVTGFQIDPCLIDSQLSGVATHAGIGFRLRATNPGFIWKCDVGHLYIRGFNKGYIVDCDINLGEIFDNDFGPIEVLDCDDRSLDVKGIYNRFRRVFVTESGNYAMVNNSSACVFAQIVTDGPVTCSGAGSTIDQITIEGINGAGAGSALEISNTRHDIRAIVLTEIPTAKCPIGVAVSAAAQQTRLGDITVNGTNFPATPISLTAGSSGTMLSASIPPGGAKISTSTSVISNWRFLGDVSSAFNGDHYIDPKVFIEYSSGRINLRGGTRIRRLGLTYSATIATDSSLAEWFTITATNNTAFTISNPTNPVDGASIEYTIYNASGGAMGAITWGTGAFKMSAWTNPANGFNRTIRFRYDGSFWVQEIPNVDVPN